MRNTCEGCPNRHLHRIAVELDPAIARDIESAGCTWWWGIQETNEETGKVRVTEQCGREYLVNYLARAVAESKLASGTAQDARGEAKAMHRETMQGLRAVASLVAGLEERVAALEGSKNSRKKLSPGEGAQLVEVAGAG